MGTKTTKTSACCHVYMLCIVQYFSLMAQPGDYPPQAPGTISTCQINANCSSGNSLDQEKDAVGLLYYERHDLIPLLSYYKGTTAIVRKAGNNSGVIMTAGHILTNPEIRNWIRYRA